MISDEKLHDCSGTSSTLPDDVVLFCGSTGRQEVAEIELADLALGLDADVEIIVQLPGQREKALGPHEFARQTAGARLRQFRILDAERALQAPLVVQLAAVGDVRLAAPFLDARRAFRQRAR